MISNDIIWEVLVNKRLRMEGYTLIETMLESKAVTKIDII